MIAAAYAGFAGGLLGVLQGFMPPDAFTFDTSGQLVMQTAIGGLGTLFGPLLGAMVWLYLRDFLQAVRRARQRLEAGAGSGLCAAGLLSAPRPDRRRCEISSRALPPPPSRPLPWQRARVPRRRCPASGRRAAAATTKFSGPALEARGLTKSFGGLVANRDIDFAVDEGELRGIIGPNGAGKSTFFKMLTCELPPSAGRIIFHGRDITGMDVARVCQLGLTKSYQVNQLFTRLTRA